VDRISARPLTRISWIPSRRSPSVFRVSGCVLLTLFRDYAYMEVWMLGHESRASRRRYSVHIRSGVGGRVSWSAQ
jgi:hypothetical protein